MLFTLRSSLLCLAASAVVPAVAKAFPGPLCTLQASGGDDAPALLKALQTCLQVTVPKDTTLSIRSPVNATDLKNVRLALHGTIKYYDDVAYWVDNAFYFEFQNSYTFFLLGGQNIVVDGGGTIDGSGEAWWRAFLTNSTIVRPIPLTIYKAKNVLVKDISMIQPPNWFNLIHTSSNVVYTNMNLTAASIGDIRPKNTDGWDTYRSDNVIIRNSVIHNTDDCVSFKPNSSHILIENLDCTGSHGISVGSLGQYPQYIDIVEHVLIKNVSLADSSDSVRIKVWAGDNVGSGRVNDVTWDGVAVKNVDRAITFDQCYSTAAAACAEFPSRVNITNINIFNVTGTTSGKLKQVVATVKCSPGAVCDNVIVNGFNVVPPATYGAPTTVCENLTVCGTSASQFQCTGRGSGLTCPA